jgi:hypothetical protein
MKNYRILPMYILLLFCSLFTFTEAYGQNPLLKELIKEDQDYRSGKKIARTDQERLKLVLELIGQGDVKTSEDKFNAAMVLQHTGLTLCDNRYVSISPDNYLLAHHLFKNAFESGYKEARYYVAASIDRYLSSTEGYQKYGTNRLTNQETGKDELVPIDRKTPDSERAKYGVLPLSELLKQFPEQTPKKKQ